MLRNEVCGEINIRAEFSWLYVEASDRAFGFTQIERPTDMTVTIPPPTTTHDGARRIRLMCRRWVDAIGAASHGLHGPQEGQVTCWMRLMREWCQSRQKFLKRAGDNCV